MLINEFKQSDQFLDMIICLTKAGVKSASQKADCIINTIYKKGIVVNIESSPGKIMILYRK